MFQIAAISFNTKIIYFFSGLFCINYSERKIFAVILANVDKATLVDIVKTT